MWVDSKHTGYLTVTLPITFTGNANKMNKVFATSNEIESGGPFIVEADIVGAQKCNISSRDLNGAYHDDGFQIFAIGK